jgi:hypothetical protein
MSTFDIVPDAPGLLRSESINITLKFDRTGPSTGRVSWNIPTPAAGCTSDNQAYCGIVVTLDTKPASAAKSPKKGQIYNSDPTADANLFAGDKLDTAMVIGAFYQDRTTTFFDITGLMPNTPYYVSGFPCDCQLRYFVEGVHAYSTEFANRGTNGTNGTQVVVLNSNQPTMGVQPSDSTGLLITETYSFDIQVGLVPKPNRPVDSVECKPVAPTYTIDIDGALAQTYEELVVQINKQFALLSNGAQGPTPPNTGAYYWNNNQKKLFQWNGYQHVEVPTIIEATAPNNVVVDTFWLNTTTDVLSTWNGTVWVTVTVIPQATDPTAPLADSSYWYDGSQLYVWNGNTWCQIVTYDQATDPSLAPTILGGSYWYDDANGIMYKWNDSLDMWTATTAIQYHLDPNTLVTGTNWYNEVAGKLYTLNVPSPGWNEETNVQVSETEPLYPAPGKYWYNPATMELFQRDALNLVWEDRDVVVFPLDPLQRSSCDLWWDTTTDILKVWNTVGSVWVPVTAFYQQPTDPSLPPPIEEGAGWYNTTTGELYVWENGCFKLASVVTSPTDPTQSVAVGSVWHDTTNDTWFVRGVGVWTAIDPIASPSDPQTLPSGTFWYNTSNAGLYQWNGASWVSITYSTSPLTPTTGTLWYDTVNNALMTWSGTAWVAATPIVTVEHDCNGNLLFTDTTIGSLSYIGIKDVTLFEALDVTFTIHDTNPGTDGASSTPSYMEVGIGTDGSDAIRNALANDIRYELGYPVIDVELTKEQIDYAISRALATLRQRSGAAYKRGFFFMSIKANEQRFFLTNKISGMNKIVDVLGVYRMTGSFLSSAHGAGVYGQIVMQHMYNMGTFDLLSYHIMAEYTKLMEILFAARITYTWNEQTREIWLHNKFPLNERMVAIEATVERTEQDIMSDRYVQSWIRKYASGVCKLMLAEIRGKFSSLPGASGSVTLNAGELRQAGQQDLDTCIAEIENYTVDKPEEYGMGTQFTFG